MFFKKKKKVEEVKNVEQEKKKIDTYFLLTGKTKEQIDDKTPAKKQD